MCKLQPLNNITKYNKSKTCELRPVKLLFKTIKQNRNVNPKSVLCKMFEENCAIIVCNFFSELLRFSSMPFLIIKFDRVVLHNMILEICQKELQNDL